MKNDNVSNSCIGFVGLLQLLFIALKLMGYIGWEWWKVFLPLIIQSIYIVLLIIVIAINELL